MREGSENICHRDLDISDILSVITQSQKVKPGLFIIRWTEFPRRESLLVMVLHFGLRKAHYCAPSCSLNVTYVAIPAQYS